MSTILDILGSIGFDWRVALANLINFLIVYALLAKFILPSVRRMLAERKAAIDQGLLDAERAKAVLESARAESDSILAEGRAKAHEVIVEAQHAGNEIIRKAEEAAVAKGEAMIAKAEKEIDAMRVEALRALDVRARELVVEGVERVLRAKLDSAKDAELIDAALVSTSNTR